MATCWLLVLAHAGLLWTTDLASSLASTLGWLLLAFFGLAMAQWRLSKIPAFGASDLLLVAGLLRLLLLPLPPSLSDDVYRYVWDGRVASSGLNPYVLAPDSPELIGLRDDLWERLPHREVATVYPPLAMAVFSIAARLPLPVPSLKIFFALVDLGNCALLLLLARRLRLPPTRVIWYAWNPLVSLETAGMGHVDALGVGAILLVAVGLTTAPARPIRAALASSVGVLIKLVPVVAFPAWARQSGRPGTFLLVGGGIVTFTLTAWFLASGGVPPGLLTYGVSWEFNGPLFEPLWRLLDASGVTSGIESLLDWAKSRTRWHDFWNLFYPWNYPKFLAKLVLSAGLLIVLLLVWRDRQPVTAMGKIFGSVVLFSATVYPWYVLWVLPWAALCQHAAWLALSGLILLSYLPQYSELPLFPGCYLTIWVPFLLLMRSPRSRWSTA